MRAKYAFNINFARINHALFLIAIGTFKKIVLADSLAYYVNVCFSRATANALAAIATTTAGSLNYLQAHLGVISYAFQIYLDFSGYCDIALGSAALIGITLPLNFNDPYKAISISDFWRRWHITLGQFFSKYLYIPLGGNRSGKLKTYRNLLIVMLISGLWHGAGLNFIVWGALHGLGMLLPKVCHSIRTQVCRKTSDAPCLLSPLIARTFTFIYVSLAWVCFKCNNLQSAIYYYRTLFNYHSLKKFALADCYRQLGLKSYVDVKWLIAVLAVSAITIFFLPNAQTLYQKQTTMPRRALLLLGGALLLVTAFYKMVTIPYTEFIYFNF